MVDTQSARPPAVVTAPTGLTAGEVAERVAAGATNTADDRTSRTLGEIARANILTRFNAILGIMFVAIAVVGEFRDSLFAVVLVCNALIGIVQEWRSKRTLDRLAVLNAPSAHAVRDGAVVELVVEAVVRDDLLELRTGDQVPCDGVVRIADGLEVDESLLTGESDAMGKAEGDEVLSGSIVVAGRGRFQTTRVGADAYARTLATEARRFTVTPSELQQGTNQILKYVTWALIPTVTLLSISQFRSHPDDWRRALQGVVAGVVAMVPEGLVLLTSLAFALAAVALARRQVLVQELPAVEGLARVDIVCVDKTGTITEGVIEFDSIEHFGGENPVTEALGALAADEGRNATMNALCTAFPEPAGWTRTQAVPFSSARKWSASSFDEHGSWVFGAPEMVLAGVASDAPARARADELAASGRRVLLLAHTPEALIGETLPHGLEPRALVLFEEKMRPDAPATFRYFTEQGVGLRVISGDNPLTVGAVAARAGIPNADRIFDARELPEDQQELGELLDEYAVFGRVTPQQKRAMVRALQSRGHVVAMTGDGVNDALALKDADIGVAMGNGAAATRAVAQVVLLDNRFDTMPDVVAEGRRVIANVERVSNLYITKTVYATLIALFVGIAQIPYPFLPRHLTIVSSLAIGIPSFFLALAPNNRRYVPGFVDRVLRFTIPAGTVIAFCVLTVYLVVDALDGLTRGEASTCATVVLVVTSLWVLVILARPFTAMRAVLVGGMVALFAGILAIPALRSFFELEIPESTAALAVTALACVVGAALLECSVRVSAARVAALAPHDGIRASG